MAKRYYIDSIKKVKDFNRNIAFMRGCRANITEFWYSMKKSPDTDELAVEVDDDGDLEEIPPGKIISDYKKHWKVEEKENLTRNNNNNEGNNNQRVQENKR